MSKNVIIETNISEAEQMSNHQNSSIHGDTNGNVISIDVEANIPKDIKNQEDIKLYIEQELKSLSDKGWKFNISIGKESI